MCGCKNDLPNIPSYHNLVLCVYQLIEAATGSFLRECIIVDQESLSIDPDPTFLVVFKSYLLNQAN
jgi:hypothetical protein